MLALSRKVGEGILTSSPRMSCLHSVGLFAVLFLQATLFGAQPPSVDTTQNPDQPAIPTCMIVDDPAPFINNRWTEDKSVVQGDSHLVLPRVRPLGRAGWGSRASSRSCPASGGIEPIDGSLGEYPGHTREERLEWIEMIKTLYEPRFTITPEIITHQVCLGHRQDRSPCRGCRGRTTGWPRSRWTSRPATSPRRCRCSRTRGSPSAA